MRLIAVAVIAFVASACSNPPEKDPPDAGQPNLCVGGVIIEGECHARCDPEKCLPGNTCVDNACVLECTSHEQCARYTQSCLPAKEDGTGRDIFTCQDVEVMEYGDPCPQGNECSGVCYGVGDWDPKAYCTVTCLADADCPAGYECGYQRDPTELCGTSKGNNNLCGQSSAPCIAPESLSADGGGIYVEGAFCLQKRVCVKRGPCAPCESDVDCSWTGTHCVQVGLGKRCAATCAQSSDCDRNMTCFEGHCVPPNGECEGQDFCSPCRFDTDCGPNKACIQLKGNERGCIDFTFPDTCTTDLDCPVSPGGLHGQCVDVGGRNGCYAPYNQAFNFYSCY